MNEERRLSKYECLEEFGAELLTRGEATQKVSRLRRARRAVRRRGVAPLAAFALLGGGGAAGVAVASEIAGSDQPAVVVPSPNGYQQTLDAGLSIPLVTIEDGNHVYGPDHCKAAQEWWLENTAEKWMNGEYASPADWPKPPEDICG